MILIGFNGALTIHFYRIFNEKIRTFGLEVIKLLSQELREESPQVDN